MQTGSRLEPRNKIRGQTYKAIRRGFIRDTRGFRGDHKFPPVCGMQHALKSDREELDSRSDSEIPSVSLAIPSLEKLKHRGCTFPARLVPPHLANYACTLRIFRITCRLKMRVPYCVRRRIERDRAREEKKGQASGGGYARRADAERANKRQKRRKSGGEAEDKDVNHNM